MSRKTRFIPLYAKNISVKVDRMYEAKQFVSGNWQWLIATLLLPLIGVVWHRLIRKPKETPLLP